MTDMCLQIPRLRPVLGCQSGLATLNPTTTIPAWAGVIAFDTVLFVLTLTKAIYSCEHPLVLALSDLINLCVTDKAARTRLLTILIRDGFAYYSVMLGKGYLQFSFLR